MRAPRQVGLFWHHSLVADQPVALTSPLVTIQSKTGPAMHRFLAGAPVAAAIALLSGTAFPPAGVEETCALSMRGDEACPDGPRDHFPWAT